MAIFKLFLGCVTVGMGIISLLFLFTGNCFLWFVCFAIGMCALTLGKNL